MYMKVVIRADASAAIGSGHVMRCLTLAGQLRKNQGAGVVFVMRELPGNLINLAEQEGFRVLVLPRAEENDTLQGYERWLTVPVEQDAAETLSALEQWAGQADRLVVDSYALDYRWESAMRPAVREIMVIDDLANRRHDCDILLDQNFYLDRDSRYQGLVPGHCRLLLGPEHALLREEFYEAKKHLRRRNGKIKNILVFYGGSDLTDETSKAVRALAAVHEEVAREIGRAAGDQQENFTVDVIVGQSNPRRDEVERLCGSYGFIAYHCQVRNMAEFMNRADLMLGAGGSTTWERLFLQLPALVTAIADNQVQGCHDCSQAGLIEYLGLAEDVTAEDLAAAVRKKLFAR